MAKRRANGEGNIRKRKDGRWEGRYTAGYDPETGKRITKNVLGKSQAEVKEKLKRAQEDSKRIDTSKSQDLTVGQWATLWFENYAKPSIRESTAEHYRNFVENHIVPGIGKIKLRKLTTLDIQKFYNRTRESGRIQRYEGMEVSGLSNETIRSLHAMLRPMPGPSGDGAADSIQPRRELQAATEGEKGNADHPAGKAGRLPTGGRGTWSPPNVLPGIDHRPPAR